VVYRLIEDIDSKKIKLLLIEDNPRDVRLISEYLLKSKEIKIDLTVKTTLSEGRHHLENTKTDIILLDLNLPDSTGYDTIIQIKEIIPLYPFIILTGYIDLELARKAVHIGAQDYIVKGQIDAHPLIRSIIYAIDRYNIKKIIETSAKTYQNKENRLKEVIDKFLDCITIVNQNGKILFLNLRSEMYFGWKTNQCIGHIDENLLEIGKKEIRIMREGNEPSIVEENTTTIEWEGDNAFLLIFRDITERRNYENNLCYSEQKYRDLFENSPYPIIILDKNGNVLDYNSKLMKLGAYHKNEFINLHYSKVPLFKKANQEHVAECINDTLNGFNMVSLEFSLPIKDGLEIWVRMYFSLINMQNKTWIYILLQDITEIKKSKLEMENLERTLSSLEALIEGAPLGIIILKRTGEILKANQKAIDILKINQNDLMKTKVYTLFDPNAQKLIEEHYIKVSYDDDATSVIEVSFLNREENHFDIELTSLGLELNQVKIIQSYILDLTDKKADKKQLEILLDNLIQTINFKANFMATMSHELRTPLNAILGFTSLLIEESYGKLNDTQKEFLEDILVTGNDLKKLIDAILDFSQIEVGKFELNYSYFNLYDLFNEIHNIIKHLYLNKNLSFEVEGIMKNTMIYADSLRIKQVLINLLENAIKFTKKGMICLRFLENKDNWEFQIEDTGMGILEKDFEHVFKEFVRVGNYSKNEIPGVGLGLTLTRRIINLHRGKIWFESEIGKGSTFYFAIPKKI